MIPNLLDTRRTHWRITIERPNGTSWVCDRPEQEQTAANAAALIEFYSLHPEGALEAIRLYSKALT